MRRIVLTVALLAVATSAHAAQAFWTGKQEMVQTVTYQTAWRCEYSYNGQKFYFVFKDRCPSSVEVQ